MREARIHRDGAAVAAGPRRGPLATLGPMSLSLDGAASGAALAGLAGGSPLWLASAVALVAYAITALRPTVPVLRKDDAPAASALPLGTALVTGWVAQGAAIAVHATGLGESQPGARFGFAPALSVTVWLVLAVYAVESRVLPLPTLRRALALLGAASVALALAFPGEWRPGLASPLAPLHWVLGIAAYGLVGAAVLHAALLGHAERQMRVRPAGGVAPAPLGLPLLRLEKLTFRFVVAGFVVLSATLLVGWWFASPWRWDHKSVFSLLAWAVFAGLLIGRHGFGWRGRRATRWLYAGASLLLLAYVGSRFVLEVLMHRSGPA